MSKRIQTIFTLILIGLTLWQLHAHMPSLIQWSRELGGYAIIGFFMLYCFTALLFLPVEPVVLAVGAVFGFYYGLLINLFCAMISATIAFMLSRMLGSNWLSDCKKKWLTRIMENFNSLGWKSLAVSRMTPFLPCAIVSYGYGLTQMRLLVYTIINFIFFTPYKLMVTYIGSHL
jgi:uncharacterized membrane protein YdjX (TVP38/TMEM64 family)